MSLADLIPIATHAGAFGVGAVGGFLVDVDERIEQRKEKMENVISDIQDYELGDFVVLRVEPFTSSFLRGWHDVEVVAYNRLKDKHDEIDEERLKHWKKAVDRTETARAVKVELRHSGDDVMIRVHSRDREQVRSTVEYVLRKIKEFEQDPAERVA